MTIATTPGSHRYRLMWQSLLHFVRNDVLTAALGMVGVVVIWEIVSLFTSRPWLPPPGTVISTMGSLLEDAEFRSAFLSSLGQTLIGFAIAVVVGATCGIAMAVSRLANMALRYYVDGLLIVPSVALAPVLIIVFGITTLNVIILTTLFAVAIIAINSASAVRSMDETWMEVGRVMGANRTELIWRIMIPAILPQFFGGLHLGVTRAFKGMIVGQVFLGVIGIGAYLAQFQQAFDGAGIWSIAVLLIAASLLLTWTVRATDHVINYWAYRD